MIHNYYKLFFIFFGQTIFFSGGQFKKKSSAGSFIHGSQYMLNVYLMPWFLAHKKYILIYSQMRFQLYQVHIMTVIGLKSGKKSINWGSVGIQETLR